MLISDWSSDVCSSDLVGQRSVVFVLTICVLGNIQVELAYRVGPVILQLPAFGVLQTFARQHHDRAAHPRNNVPGHHALGRAVIHEHTAAVRLETHGGLFARRHISQLGRSEEHTSELQSLMRISYAVFCLKKKQNNTKKNTT